MQQCSEYLWGISGTVWQIALIGVGLIVILLVILFIVMIIGGVNHIVKGDHDEMIEKYSKKDK